MTPDEINAQIQIKLVENFEMTAENIAYELEFLAAQIRREANVHPEIQDTAYTNAATRIITLFQNAVPAFNFQGLIWRARDCDQERDQ